MNTTNPESSCYKLSKEDKLFLAEIQKILWKISRAPFIKPKQLVVIAQMLTALEYLPQSLDKFIGIVQLLGPKDRYEEGYEYITHTIGIEKEVIYLEVYECVHGRYGADTFPVFSWHISLEEPHDRLYYCFEIDQYRDYDGNLVDIDLDWKYEDLETFTMNVSEFDLSDDEYSLEVSGGEGVFNCDCK